MAQKKTGDVTPMPRAASAPRRVVFVRDLKLDAYIGAYEHEQGAPQPVRIDMDVDVIEPSNPTGDRLEDVVCYSRLTDGVKAIIAEGHIRLVETLAERIAEMVMAHPMAIAVTVRVEKPNAIAEAGAAGVEIERRKY